MRDFLHAFIFLDDVCPSFLRAFMLQSVSYTRKKDDS